MKHSRIISTLLILLVTVFITSCSKKDEPEPSMGDQVAGNYTLIKFTYSGLTADLPFTNPTTGITLSGKVEVTKSADDKAKAKITLSEKDKTGKVTDETTDLGEATLKKATTGEIEAYLGTVKIGSYSNGQLSLLATDPDLGPVTIIGKKN